MKFFLTLLSIVVCFSGASAQESSIFSYSSKAPNIHHKGDVWLKHLSKVDGTFDHNVVVAKFSKGARLNWHSHPKGQKF